MAQSLLSFPLRRGGRRDIATAPDLPSRCAAAGAAYIGRTAWDISLEMSAPGRRIARMASLQSPPAEPKKRPFLSAQAKTGAGPSKSHRTAAQKRNHRTHLQECEAELRDNIGHSNWELCDCIVITFTEAAERAIAAAPKELYNQCEKIASTIEGRYYRLCGPQPRHIDDVDAPGGRIYRQEAASDPNAANSEQLFLFQPYSTDMWVFNSDLDILLERTEQNPPIASVSNLDDPDLALVCPSDNVHAPWDEKKTLATALGMDKGDPFVLVEAYQVYAERIVREKDDRIQYLEGLLTNNSIDFGATEKPDEVAASPSAGEEDGDEADGADGEERHKKWGWGGKAKGSRHGWMPRAAKMVAYHEQKDWKNFDGYAKHLKRKFGDFNALVNQYGRWGIPHSV